MDLELFLKWISSWSFINEKYVEILPMVVNQILKNSHSQHQLI